MRISKTSDSEIFDNYIKNLRSFKEKRQNLNKIAISLSSLNEIIPESNILSSLFKSEGTAAAFLRSITDPGGNALAIKIALLNLFDGLPVNAQRKNVNVGGTKFDSFF